MTYDPEKISYSKLVQCLFDRIDPTSKLRQGNDVGTQYRPGIYYHTEEQKKTAEEFCNSVANCAVEVKPASSFYPAELYHQQYLEKGGRFGRGQSASKGCTDPIRCYG